MAKNFDPGFDREKFAFLELANKGNGLDPIEYIYAGSASFIDLLVSDVKGGLFDIDMLFVININAQHIDTITLNAVTATIDTATINTIYSNNIHNDDTINTKDLYVTDHIQLSSAGSLGTAFFFAAEFLVTGISASFPVGTFAVATEYCSINTPLGITAFNTPELSINAVESLLAGFVQIYAGTSAMLSAPTVNIGRVTSLPLGASTTFINIQANQSVTTTAPIVNIDTDVLNINATSVANLHGVKAANISSEGLIDITSINGNITLLGETIGMTANNVLIMRGHNTSMIADGAVYLSSSTSILAASPALDVPTPMPIVGEGVLLAGLVPVTGTINFILPNVVTIIDGLLKQTTFNVSIVCV